MKDAVQVRVLYGNGNILKATSKFEVFNQWQLLLKAAEQTQQRAELPALFEQAAQLWSQHPAPVPAAIQPWTKVFGDRRDLFKGDDSAKGKFQQQLADFLDAMWQTTPKKALDREIQNWLKLAAFVLRKRQINISLGGP